MLFCSAQGHGGIGYGVLEATVCARRCAGAFSACDARRLCSQRNGRAVLRILERCAIKSELWSDTLLRLSWVLGFVSAENQRLSASAPKKVKSFDLAKGLDLNRGMARQVLRRAAFQADCCRDTGACS